MPTKFLRALSIHFPIFKSLKNYDLNTFNSDLFAGIITAILLIPQGMAYALLAGLPVQVGIYSSILPALAYVLLGTSRVLSVGPVSVAAIMVASALTSPEISNLGPPTQNAMILALEGGVILCLMSIMGLGNLVHFISQPVLSGFTSGAAIIILASQLPNMIGFNFSDCNTIANWTICLANLNYHEMALGLLVFALLSIMGLPLVKLLIRFNVKKHLCTGISKSAPLVSVIITTMIVVIFSLDTNHNVQIVGSIPQGFPDINLNFLDITFSHAFALLPSAFFISLIAYVESVAIAKVIASERGERILPNQELVALGTSNLVSSISGGMPVAGGFSRTMVNYSAGAQTQIAMLIAVLIITTVLTNLTQTLEYIPKAALAAIIIIAVLPLVNLKKIIQIWRQDKSDGLSQLITLLGVLVLGIEEGIVLGVIVTIFSYLRRTGKPHIAVVGRIKNSDHFRNIKRHEVETWEELLLVRIDENITFANINFISEYIERKQIQTNAKNIVLIFSSVSYVDTTAIISFKELINSLKLRGSTLHFSEVKGPVLDKLEKMNFIGDLVPGRIFFQTNDAVRSVTKILD